MIQLQISMDGQHSFAIDEFWIGGRTNVSAHSSIDLGTEAITENGNIIWYHL